MLTVNLIVQLPELGSLGDMQVAALVRLATVNGEIGR